MIAITEHENLDEKHQKIIAGIEAIVGETFREISELISSEAFSTNSYKTSKKEIKTLNFFDIKDLKDEKFHQLFTLVANCTKLTHINFWRCNLVNISGLKKLTFLTHVILIDNQIKDVTQISHLTNLKHLSIDRNLIPIDTLITLLKKVKITSLFLRRCQLDNCEFLTFCPQLTHLDLYDNNIENISPLKELKHLQKVSLGNNNISQIPQWLIANHASHTVTFVRKEYRQAEKAISLEDNPITTPPLEIAMRGNDAILNYYQQLEAKQQDYLFEAKMLIVGEPGAGKTSLARKINNPESKLPKEADTTHGIDVLTYNFDIHQPDFPNYQGEASIEGKEFRTNLWDFGGQKIYLATHRFFLSNRALYVLISDSRKEDTDFNYWLHVVEMFSPNSPILIILNEKDQREHQLDPNMLNHRFSNIVGVEAVDLSDDNRTRLKQIRKTIRHQISKLPHVGSPLPASWLTVRDKLEQNPSKTIRPDQYLDICKKAGIDKKADAMQLSQYFHDIGVFLHFHDDEVLKHTIFLDSNWTTSTIYALLDDNSVFKNQGIISKSQAKHIWQDEQTHDKCDEFFRLMHKFHLAFEFKSTAQYIVPAKLPIANPQDLEQIQQSNQYKQSKQLQLGYKYKQFMPRGLLFNLMVELQHLIEDKDKVWRQAALFIKGNTQALVVEDHYEQTINLTITGGRPRDLLIIIMDKLDAINEQYQKIIVDKQIPCICPICDGLTKPSFYKLQRLENFSQNNEPTILCEKSFTQVNIAALLAQVDKSAAPLTQSPNSHRNQIFISYSHKNPDIFERVKVHFKGVKNANNNFIYWEDTQIRTGTDWFEDIKQSLEATKIAVLLISADFLASDFIQQHELRAIFEAMKHQGATIIPVLVSDCSLKNYPSLSGLQFVNKLEKPLNSLSAAEQETYLKILTETVDEALRVC